MVKPEVSKTLSLIAKGRISATEGEQILAAMHLPEITTPSSEPETPSPPFSPATPGWRRFWPAVIGAGAVLMALGVAYTVLVILGENNWPALLWTLPAMSLGLVAVLVGQAMQAGTWLHIRVEERGAKTVSLSFPLPLRWVSVGLRAARPFSAHLREYISNDIIEALFNADLAKGFWLDVDESDDEHQYLRHFLAKNRAVEYDTFFTDQGEKRKRPHCSCRLLSLF